MPKSIIIMNVSNVQREEIELLLIVVVVSIRDLDLSAKSPLSMYYVSWTSPSLATTTTTPIIIIAYHRFTIIAITFLIHQLLPQCTWPTIWNKEKNWNTGLSKEDSSWWKSPLTVCSWLLLNWDTLLILYSYIVG